TDQEIKFFIFAAILVFGTLFFIWEKLVLMTINENIAKADNINVKIIQSIFLILLVIFVATCVKIVGILLITSMLIIPAATSRQITSSPGKMAIVSGMLGIISILFGVYLSVIADIPTGPSIILVLTVIFILVLSLFKKN
ncbi:MAG: metal ABC transporter permease, partial [Thermodesulfobacteriota bacterium]|nr:metal ABC transporter permease [Thermodesulfobacteriota bacterium]